MVTTWRRTSCGGCVATVARWRRRGVVGDGRRTSRTEGSPSPVSGTLRCLTIPVNKRHATSHDAYNGITASELIRLSYFTVVSAIKKPNCCALVTDTWKNQLKGFNRFTRIANSVRAHFFGPSVAPSRHAFLFDDLQTPSERFLANKEFVSYAVAVL